MPIDNHDTDRASIQDSLIAFVARHMTCEDCDETYSPGDVQVVLHEGDQWTLTATCPACHAERTVTAYDRAPYQELRPREPVIPGPITQDGVDEWAAYLATFGGDMYDLLAQLW